MTTVQNTVTDPAGNPYALGLVRISLVTGTPGGAGYLAAGDIINTATVQCDLTGHWSANLTPNASITPANTYYQVVEGAAVSAIVVPASGGPYNLSQLLVTPPPTPAGVGIAGVQVAAGGTIAGVRPEINLIAGSGMTVSAADNSGANRVDVTLASAGGVTSVNGHTGAVVLAASDVSAVPVAAEGAAGGVATLDGSAHLTASQAANLLVAANNLSDLASAATSRTNLGLAYDATVTDIQPIGTGALGSTGHVADAGHVHPYEPWQFYVKTYGARGDNATDDTAAIAAAVAAAVTYAQSHNGYAEVIFDPVTYLLSSPPTTGGATQGSAQIPLPVIADTAQKIVLVLRGTRDATALYHWLQTTPQRAGAVLRSTYNAGNTIPATGEASVIGGPTPHFLGDPPSAFSNMLIVIDGIAIELDAPGNMCGFDFRDLAEANVISAGVLALSSQTGAPAIPPANWSFGLAMPVANNNDLCNIGYYSCEGLVYGLIVYEHVAAASIRLINCFDGLVCWSSSGFPHGNLIQFASIEGCQQCIVLAGSFNKLDIELCSIEWGAGHIINDGGAVPGLGRINLRSNGNTGASLNAALNGGATAVNVVNGALALEITNLDQAIVPVTPPAVPASGTALTNPFWRAAEIHISGGTVTQVAIDGVNQLSTSGAFTLAPGHTITPTYSVAPAWAWTLVR